MNISSATPRYAALNQQGMTLQRDMYILQLKSRKQGLDEKSVTAEVYVDRGKRFLFPCRIPWP